MSFGRLRQRILLKCMSHVQHDYFSSFNQSDHCFLALSLPLPSSLLKLPICVHASRMIPLKPVIFLIFTLTSSKQRVAVRHKKKEKKSCFKTLLLCRRQTTCKDENEDVI